VSNRAFTVLAVLFALAAADTLDFGRQVVVVTVASSGSNATPTSLDLAVRAAAVVKSANYDAEQTVQSFLASHAAADRRFNRLRWESRPGAVRYLSDGTVVTDYEFAITGPVLSALLPVTGNGRLLGRACCPLCGQAWPEGRPVPDGTRLAPPDAPGATCSGILIDARDIGFRPALFPRVVTENGEEVIGPGFAESERLSDWGQLALYRDRLAALAGDRIGPNPLAIRALRATGTNSADIVISQGDALRVHGSRGNMLLVGACQVGLLVN
jgi:hypothetical protein